VSEKWVKESTRTFSEISSTVGYASLLWTGTFLPDTHYFSAQGGLGQYIWVFPSLEMVVVFTQHYVDNNDHAREILTQYILPAATQ
jgi:CubicO group peptidase (beta-lactamase class C family)